MQTKSMSPNPATALTPIPKYLKSGLVILGLLAAVLTGFHDVTGWLWKRELKLKPLEFREQRGNAFRYSLPESCRGMPSRYVSETRVSREGMLLTRMNSRQSVIEGGPGQFALTAENLWISPFGSGGLFPAGMDAGYTLRMPFILRPGLRLAVYAGGLLMLAWLLTVKEFRHRWMAGADVTRKALDRLLGLNVDQASPSAHPQTATRSTHLLLFLLTLAILLLRTDAKGPIWIDEFLHFAMGAYDSTTSAWQVVRETTVGVNHGQTGVYMMLDYWLLKGFGASAVALRLPSLLSAAWLLLSAAAVIRYRGFPPGWQCLALLSLAAQSQVMQLSAEARPYIPLAAASMGTLAYYLAREERRHTFPIRVLGWGSILLGTLMHPYFALYWLLLFSFAHLVKIGDGTLRPGWRSLFRHVNPPLSCVGAFAFFAAGALTWLRGGPVFKFDPFEWLKRGDLLSSAVNSSHLEFLGIPFLRLAFLAVCGLCPLLFLIPGRLRQRIGPLVPPALLVIMALSISAFLSYLSWRRDYWILPRQWVASVAVVPIGIVWLAGMLSRGLRLILPWGALLMALGLGTLFCWSAYQSHQNTLKVSAAAAGPGAPADHEGGKVPENPDEWVTLANRNLVEGGPVWLIFKKYYQP